MTFAQSLQTCGRAVRSAGRIGQDGPLVRGSDRYERAVLRPDGFLWAEWLALGWVLCPCFYSTAVRTFTVVPSSVEV